MADLVAGTSTLSPSVYFGCMKVPFQEGTRDECVKGFEASMGKFYRHQPGYIYYLFGACQQDPNALLGLHVWSDRQLFDSLPTDPDDLAKLSQIRQPYMERIAGPPTAFTAQHSVGDISALPTPKDTLQAPPSFDEIMGVNFHPNLATVPRNQLYFQIQQVKTLSGKAHEYAMGMDQNRGSLFRKQDACLLYLSGIMDDSTALFCSVWESKQAFTHTTTVFADKIKEATRPFNAMLAQDNTSTPVVEAYDTVYVVGDDPFRSNESECAE